MSTKSMLDRARRAGPGRAAMITAILAASLGMAWAQQPEESAIFNHLNAVVSWYRQLASADETAGRPSDVIYLESARALARQCAQLAFESAESESQLLPATPKSNSGTSSEALPQQQSLAATVAATTSRINQVQGQIEALNRQIPRTSGKRHKDLLSQRDELKSELDLENTLQGSLQTLSAFLSNSQTGHTSFVQRIADLKRTVPELSTARPAQHTGQAAKQVISPAQRASTSGLIGQVSILFGQMRVMNNVDHLIDETTAVRQSATKVRAPLLDMLRAIVRQARDLASGQAVSNPVQMQQARQALDAMTARFKQLSKATLPLTQETILLDQCRASLSQWRYSISKEDSRVLRSLLTRVFGILIGLGVVIAFSEVWRRATVRYVREARRRRQLLLVRRFVVGLLMVVVISLGFVTEFSSLATFAGFLTAGIAVALQTVILSVAAYFFIIGRYGVRVGDRITVSGVTGDVVSIGLVRFHLMELAGTGLDLYPTGRLVVFPNSMLFQNTPLFRQLPGTAYAWHEATVTFQRDGNYKLAQNKLLEGINSVYSGYRDQLEEQHSSIERLTDTSIPVPAPGAHLKFVENGFELTLRYPVDPHRSSEIDTQVTKRLSQIIDAAPELKASAGPVQIRSSLKT